MFCCKYDSAVITVGDQLRLELEFASLELSEVYTNKSF